VFHVLVHHTKMLQVISRVLRAPRMPWWLSNPLSAVVRACVHSIARWLVAHAIVIPDLSTLMGCVARVRPFRGKAQQVRIDWLM
jgi:hypothetical protein